MQFIRVCTAHDGQCISLRTEWQKFIEGVPVSGWRILRKEALQTYSIMRAIARDQMRGYGHCPQFAAENETFGQRTSPKSLTVRIDQALAHLLGFQWIVFQTWTENSKTL